MKLWLDDVRRPPTKEWYHAQTLDQAKEVLLTGGVIEISLDYDLKYLRDIQHFANWTEEDLKMEQESGFDLLEWMCQSNLLPEFVRIHSSNKKGSLRISQLLKSLGYQEASDGRWQRSVSFAF